MTSSIGLARSAVDPDLAQTTIIHPIGHDYIDAGALTIDIVALLTVALNHVDDVNPYRQTIIELASDDLLAGTIYCLLAEHTAELIRAELYRDSLRDWWDANDDFDCWLYRYLDADVIKDHDALGLTVTQGRVALYCSGFPSVGYTTDELHTLRENPQGLIRAALATARDFTC